MNIEHFSNSILPPDSLHGDVKVEQLYATFSEEWVENAAFIVESEEGVVWAAFNDYFLSIGEGKCPVAEERKSIIRLWIGEGNPTSDPKSGIHIRVPRSRFSELEQGALGVWREDSASLKEDVLSLLCLCAILGIADLH